MQLHACSHCCEAWSQPCGLLLAACSFSAGIVRGGPYLPVVDLMTCVLGDVQAVRQRLQLSAHLSLCRLVLLACVAMTHSLAMYVHLF